VVDAGQGNCGGSLPVSGSDGVRTTVVGREVALPGTKSVRTATLARSLTVGTLSGVGRVEARWREGGDRQAPATERRH
jgi:hypothetical protein